ncbi:hypothetical protein AB0D32_10155 [Micromonospora sp. NPDC048170]|uniref:hypothetical protein n=1 Tax=Micromonospora sp. NPDC048170 TaxID=3154819 RepID=UPI0033EEDC63
MTQPKVDLPGADLRVAEALVLLLALPLTQVLRLRKADVMCDLDHTHLLIDGRQLAYHPASPTCSTGSRLTPVPDPP